MGEIVHFGVMDRHSTSTNIFFSRCLADLDRCWTSPAILRPLEGLLLFVDLHSRQQEEGAWRLCVDVTNLVVGVSVCLTTLDCGHRGVQITGCDLLQKVVLVYGFDRLFYYLDQFSGNGY